MLRRTANAPWIMAFMTLACTIVATPAMAQERSIPTTVVSGIVYDSIGRRPVAGAAVEFVSATDPSARPFTTTSDTSGRYSVAGLPFGKYLAGFVHPALDTLGLESPLRPVELSGSGKRIDLATPSPRTVMAALCPQAAISDSTGLLIGHVRSTDDQMPIAGASVVVEWTKLVLEILGISERSYRTTARAAEPGWFAICGLPTEQGLHARAFNNADSSGFIEVQLPPNSLRHVSFFVGGATVATVPSGDTTAAAGPPETTLRGQARLSGTVVDRAGRPVVGAHALIWDTRQDAVTTDRGTFSLEGLPGGTHTLEIRAIGYVPATSTVHLAESRPAIANVVVSKVAEILPTVTVRAELVYARNLAEFDRRRRSGFGKYLSSDELARRPSATLSELLQAFQGVRVTRVGGESRVSMERNATTVIGGRMRTACVPSLYVDGVLDLTQDFDFYHADGIVGIEVYVRESTRPFEFINASNPCGVVAIWTRPPPKKP